MAPVIVSGRRYPLIPILVNNVCRNDNIALLSVLLDVIHTRIRELSEENSDSLCLGHLTFSIFKLSIIPICMSIHFARMVEKKILSIISICMSIHFARMVEKNIMNNINLHVNSLCTHGRKKYYEIMRCIMAVQTLLLAAALVPQVIHVSNSQLHTSLGIRNTRGGVRNNVWPK